MKRYLLFTVFISGMTTLAAELSRITFNRECVRYEQPRLGKHYRFNPHLSYGWILHRRKMGG